MRRATKHDPCRICGGHDGLPRGHGKRCTGYLSSDSAYYHCTRDELAGSVELKQNAGAEPTYPHILRGPCRCGRTHGVDLSALHRTTNPSQISSSQSRPGGPSGNLPPKAAGVSSHPSVGERIVATYEYTDEQGNPLYRVLRYDPKGFKQQSWVGGMWVWGLKCDPTLYHLPEVIAAVAAGDTVYVCEGEKDVEAMRAAGVVATCNSGGAGKWPDPLATNSVCRHLAGADVVIVQDIDEDDPRTGKNPGRDHAAMVMAACGIYPGTARIVRARAGKDAADHLAAGYGVADFVEIDGAEFDAETPPNSAPGLASLFARPRVSAAWMLGAEPPARDWLVTDLIPAGCTGVLAAAGGTGKGHLAMQLVCSLATGEAFGQFQVPAARGVLVVSREDDGDELHRRFKAAVEARWLTELGHVRTEQLDSHVDLMDFVGEPLAVLNEEFVEAVCGRVAALADCGLVVLDPSGKMLKPEPGRSMNDAETAAVAHAFCDQIAKRTGCAVLLVCHINKASRAKGGELEATAVLGSTQWVDLARWQLSLRRLASEDVEARGLDHGHDYLELTAPKANYSPAMAQGCLWRVGFGGALIHVPGLNQKELDMKLSLDALAECGPATVEAWEKACRAVFDKFPRGRMRSARKALVSAGRVVVSQTAGGPKGGGSKPLYDVPR